MPLYDVADLSTVWIQAQVYEDDLALLAVAQDHPHAHGSRADRRLSPRTRAFPNEAFHGTLTFVYPHVDQATRTLTVRFEIDNPEHKLRPGQHGDRPAVHPAAANPIAGRRRRCPTSAKHAGSRGGCWPCPRAR